LTFEIVQILNSKDVKFIPTKLESLSLESILFIMCRVEEVENFLLIELEKGTVDSVLKARLLCLLPNPSI
jgi:hypothetical protein